MLAPDLRPAGVRPTPARAGTWRMSIHLPRQSNRSRHSTAATAPAGPQQPAPTPAIEGGDAMEIGYTEEQQALRSGAPRHDSALLTPEVEEQLANSDGIGLDGAGS